MHSFLENAIFRSIFFAICIFSVLLLIFKFGQDILINYYNVQNSKTVFNDSQIDVVDEKSTLGSNLLRFYSQIKYLSPGEKVNLARLFIRENDFTDAEKLINPLPDTVNFDPRDYLDLIKILDKTKTPDDVIDFFYRIPEGMKTVEINDLVALAFIRKFNLSNNLTYLYEAQKYRPVDLYVKNELYLNNDKNVSLEELQKISIDALIPENEELLPWTLNAISSLYIENIWSGDYLEKALSILVWKYPDSRDLQGLLVYLQKEKPLKNNLLNYYLGEIYYLENNNKGALENFIIHADSGVDNIPSLERAIELCENEINLCSVQQTQTIKSELLSKLEEINSTLSAVCDGISPALNCVVDRSANGLENYGYQNSFEFKQGPNLIDNGNFIDWNNVNSPRYWRLLDYNFQNGEGAFLGGRYLANKIYEKYVVRISGLWATHPYSSFGLWYWRSSYAQGIKLDPKAVYILTLKYSTLNIGIKDLTIWTLGSLPVCDNQYMRTRKSQISLPASNGAWIIAELRLCNQENKPVEINPMVRLWSAGDVLLSEISLRKLDN